MGVDYLTEQLKSIRNLVDVALILRNQGLKVDRHSLLATMLEQLYQEVQKLEEYFVDGA